MKTMLGELGIRTKVAMLVGALLMISAPAARGTYGRVLGFVSMFSGGIS